MGPPPRSLAAEANDCFMVRVPRGPNRIQVCSASLRARSQAPLGSFSIRATTGIDCLPLDFLSPIQVRLKMSWVSDSADEKASHGKEDHGLGDVEAALVVTHEATVAGHPSEAALDHPAARHNFEAGLGVEAANNLDDEVEIGRLVEELASVIGPICEQVFDPGPALTDRIEDRLCTGAVGDIGGRHVPHQKTT